MDKSTFSVSINLLFKKKTIVGISKLPLKVHFSKKVITEYYTDMKTEEIPTDDSEPNKDN